MYLSVLFLTYLCVLVLVRLILLIYTSYLSSVKCIILDFHVHLLNLRVIKVCHDQYSIVSNMPVRVMSLHYFVLQEVHIIYIKFILSGKLVICIVIRFYILKYYFMLYLGCNW